MTLKPKTSTRSQQSSVRDLPVKDISQIKRNLSVVVYGRSGTGKTTFAASFPKPMLYLDVRDEGTDSIADVRGIKVLEVGSFEEFEEAYWWLKKNPTRYKTIVIDTCTQLQTMVVQEAGSRNKKRAGDWGSMTKRDWGDVSALLKEWLGNFRDLTADGMQVVFIAQDRTFNLSDEEEQNTQMMAPEIGPALSPSVAKSLNASASIVCNTFIRERKIKNKETKKTRSVIDYCLGVGPSSLYTRKVRKPKGVELPDVIVDPQFQDVLDIIKGE